MSEPAPYPRGPRTTPTRAPERADFSAAAVHAVLDEALICHVGMIVDGEPVVLPSIHARIGRRLYLHASTGARLARLARDRADPSGAGAGVPVCVTVTLLDGVVLARSQFHHSMNYRSVVVRGRAELVSDPAERDQALAALVDHVLAGRGAHSRPPNARESAATAVLRIELVEATLKHREGPPQDDAADLQLPYWAGVLPVVTKFGPPEPAEDLLPTAPPAPLATMPGSRSPDRTEADDWAPQRQSSTL